MIPTKVFHSIACCVAITLSSCDSIEHRVPEVGKIYNIESYTDDPFRSPPIAHVKVIAIKKGWVQYCHSYDTAHRTTFTRTYKEFFEMVDRYNKAQ